MVFCSISGTNSGFIISSLTGMIWGGFSEKTGTWAAPGTRHGKSRVDPGKTETTGWACLSRTAYRSGTSHPKNSKHFRVYSREKFTDSGGTYKNRTYQEAKENQYLFHRSRRLCGNLHLQYRLQKAAVGICRQISRRMPSTGR